MGESLTSDVDVTPGLSTGDNEPSRAELLVNYEKTAPRDTCQGLVAAAAAGAVLATRLTPGAWEMLVQMSPGSGPALAKAAPPEDGGSGQGGPGPGAARRKGGGSRRTRMPLLPSLPGGPGRPREP